MELALDPEQRKEMTIYQLARYIFGKIKEGKQKPREFIRYPTFPDELLKALCRSSNSQGYETDEDFALKFSEAIALLRRRGLLMENIYFRHSDVHLIRLTSVGEKSDFHDGILLLIDDAQEIVSSLKDKVRDLDPVIEQYYLESLRACQEGLYISSVICLGAASERAINCLAQAVVDHNGEYKGGIDKLQSISRLTRALTT